MFGLQFLRDGDNVVIWSTTMKTRLTIGDNLYNIETNDQWIRVELQGMRNDNVLE